MKRALALFFAITLSLSTTFSTFADDKGLADAIASAKQYINVPTERSNIDYRITNGENGALIISLDWSDDNGSTSVTLDKDGCLLNYSNNDYEREYKSLAKLTGDQTQAKADEFLKIVYGNGASDFKLENSDLSRTAHSYSYNLYKNNIKVATATAHLNIDPDTGEVIYFDGTGKEFLTLKYPSSVGINDVNTAMTAFFDGQAPKPTYHIYYDYSNKKLIKKPFLAFSIFDTNTAIDAYSNNKTNVNKYFNEYRASSKSAETEAMDDAASAQNAGGGFTPQEIAAIEHSETLIDMAKAAKIIEETFPIVNSKDFTSSNISKDRYAENYYITIYGNKVRATLNAKSGKISSFNYYNGTAIEPRKLTQVQTAELEKNAQAKVDALISKIAPAEAKKIAKPIVRTSDYNNSTSLVYNRVEYGYECSDNNLSVNVNEDGYVVSYRNSFDENLVFPKPVNVYTGNAAISALADVFDFDLCYSVDETYKVELVYCFNNNGMMSSSSKTRLNYKGEEEAYIVESGISDVEGHWCENIVKTLYNNGYKLNDVLFRPDSAITAAELDTLFARNNYRPYYAVDAEASDNDDKNKTVTRYELAEYVMEYYNLDKLKEHPEIFVVTNYTDNIEQKYVPAVAIATSLGTMKGDNNNNFNGDKTVTRAEAAAVLYNILIND